MYVSYYNLVAKPFQTSPDPKFLWLGEKHKEALAFLKIGIYNNQGFVLLTGDAGTGKTTLLNTLIKELRDDVLVAIISNPQLNTVEFFDDLAHNFDFEYKSGNKHDFLRCFRSFLLGKYNENRKVLLFVDEVQALNFELLEQVRLISNIELPECKLMNIFLVGQSEFNRTLMRGEWRALRQRITMHYHIDPLTRNETVEYIRYRLKVAGSERDIFSSGAISEIFAFSKGYPRLINIICHSALVVGCVRELKSVNTKTIRECVEELGILKEDGENDDRKKEGLAEVKNGSVRIAKRKHALRMALPISMLTLLLIIGAHLYYRGVYSEYADNVKDFRAQATAGNEKVKAGKLIKEMPKDIERTQVRNSPAQTLGKDRIEIVSTLPEEVYVETSDRDGASQERRRTADEKETSALRNEEASLTQSARTTSTSPGDTSAEEAESPDPTEVIDWLLRKHSKEKR